MRRTNKKLIFTVLLSVLIVVTHAQSNSEFMTMNSGYTNQIFYSRADGEISNISNEDWDIAFSTDPYSSTIRINDGKGVELYTYHLGDTSSWLTINNSATNTVGDPMYNSDLDWSIGAFDVNITSGLDYGWGFYNMLSHHIVGDSLFIIKTVNGNYKKLWMESKISGKYYFKYADLDGNNLFTQEVSASNFSSKNFVYFSLDQNNIVDREPDTNDWDITFTRYITSVQAIPYPVTGVFSNNNVEVAQVNGITSPNTYTDFLSHSFSTDINTIGYDWKSFQGSYIIVSDRCYFVRDLYGDVWRLVFTSFDGMSTGNIEFNTELVSSSTNIVQSLKPSTFSIYPNPTSGKTNIIYEVNSDNVKLVILDMSGRIVYQEILNETGFYNSTLPTDKLSKGVYIVSVEDKKTSLIKEKLIVR